MDGKLNYCKKCGILADWEVNLHRDCQQEIGWLQTIGWGILFSSPFIIMSVLIWWMYS